MLGAVIGIAATVAALIDATRRTPAAPTAIPFPAVPPGGVRR